MKLFNHDPQFCARIFRQHVQALVIILLWTVIALASIAGAYVAVCGLWVGVKYVLSAFIGV